MKKKLILIIFLIFLINIKFVHAGIFSLPDVKLPNTIVDGFSTPNPGSTENAIMLGNRSPDNAQVVYIIPLEMEGEDSANNKEVLSTPDNSQKIKVQALTMLLLKNGDININQAQSMVKNWATSGYVVNNLPLPNQDGFIDNVDTNMARRILGISAVSSTVNKTLNKTDWYGKINDTSTNQLDIGITSTSNDDSLFVQADPNSNSWTTATLNPKWQDIGFGIVCIIVFIWILKVLISIFGGGKPDRILKRQQRREAEEAERREKEYQKQIEWQQRKELKDKAWAKHEELLFSIRELPRYNTWRNQIFNKLGCICGHCGTSNNLEVHHLKTKSFSSLVKRNGISDTFQAVDCIELWDENNGSVLCKSCHDEMESSKQRNQFNNN